MGRLPRSVVLREDFLVQRHRWLFVVFAAAAVLIPAFAQESKPTNLAWKFKEGQTFYQTMKTETKQSMKVMGSDVNQNQTQTFIFSWTPEKKKRAMMMVCVPAGAACCVTNASRKMKSA